MVVALASCQTVLAKAKPQQVATPTKPATNHQMVFLG